MTSHMVSSLLIAHGIEKVWIASGWVQGVREPGGLSSLLASSLVMFFLWQSADLMGSESGWTMIVSYLLYVELEYRRF